MKYDKTSTKVRYFGHPNHLPLGATRVEGKFVTTKPLAPWLVNKFDVYNPIRKKIDRIL